MSNADGEDGEMRYGVHGVWARGVARGEGEQTSDVLYFNASTRYVSIHAVLEFLHDIPSPL